MRSRSATTRFTWSMDSSISESLRHTGKPLPRRGVASGGRFSPPARRLGLVRRHALAEPVPPAEVPHAFRAAEVGGTLEPLERGAQFPVAPFAVAAQHLAGAGLAADEVE